MTLCLNYESFVHNLYEADSQLARVDRYDVRPPLWAVNHWGNPLWYGRGLRAAPAKGGRITGGLDGLKSYGYGQGGGHGYGDGNGNSNGYGNGHGL